MHEHGAAGKSHLRSELKSRRVRPRQVGAQIRPRSCMARFIATPICAGESVTVTPAALSACGQGAVGEERRDQGSHRRRCVAGSSIWANQQKQQQRQQQHLLLTTLHHSGLPSHADPATHCLGRASGTLQTILQCQSQPPTHRNLVRGRALAAADDGTGVAHAPACGQRQRPRRYQRMRKIGTRRATETIGQNSAGREGSSASGPSLWTCQGHEAPAATRAADRAGRAGGTGAGPAGQPAVRACARAHQAARSDPR